MAASTRVRESYLAAIEEEAFEALGGEVYARGFISSYARFLGLDPGPLLDAHRRAQHGDERQEAARRARPGPTGVRVRSGRVAVLVVLALLVVVAVLVAGLWGDGITATAGVDVVAEPTEAGR